MPERPRPDHGAGPLDSGVWLRIIRLTRNEALTNKELALRLGLGPSTTHHHVRKLLATGFLLPQPTRRGNHGAREIPYRSIGLPWVRGPEGERPVGQAVMDACLAEVGELDVAEVTQIRFVLDLSPARHAEFTRRLDALLDEFDHDEPDRGGSDHDGPGHSAAPERTAVYVALYPWR